MLVLAVRRKYTPTIVLAAASAWHEAQNRWRSTSWALTHPATEPLCPDSGGRPGSPLMRRGRVQGCVGAGEIAGWLGAARTRSNGLTAGTGPGICTQGVE